MSISPNVPTAQESYGYESPGTPRWITILLVLMMAGIAVLGIAGYSAQTKISQDLSEQQKENDEKIGAVASEVGIAKKDIEATKGDLEATKGKLERSLGDMNVMSGLIAHNRDDLDELRRRGDRNYYEFTLQKSKSAQRVGP